LPASALMPKTFAVERSLYLDSDSKFQPTSTGSHCG